MTAPARTYRCCPHCRDDGIHDVPKDGHDLSCDLCERGDVIAERERLVAFLQGRRRDALRALLACTDAGADYWRWQGHAELSRQLLEDLGAHVPQVTSGGGVS